MIHLNISLATLVIWIIVGGLAGWLASRVVRGGGLGLLGDVVVGIIGAFLGGLVLSRLLPGVYAFTGGLTGFSLGSVIVAFVGAVILLLVVRLFTARRLHYGRTR
ncbi:MAG TPA: GlsB/YeaQ/YmgE family stress response membrane protein [Ktedonobacterales bacterium]|nr:GlsB/YeaQ/YmgE family stress response membrane protein [Ktedonobacterales bacterium]